MYCDNNPLTKVDPQGLDDKRGTWKRGSYENHSSKPVRIAFDLTEEKITGGKRREYYIVVLPIPDRLFEDRRGSGSSAVGGADIVKGLHAQLLRESERIFRTGGSGGSVLFAAAADVNFGALSFPFLSSC